MLQQYARFAMQHVVLEFCTGAMKDMLSVMGLTLELYQICTIWL